MSAFLHIDSKDQPLGTDVNLRLDAHYHEFSRLSRRLGNLAVSFHFKFDWFRMGLIEITSAERECGEVQSATTIFIFESTIKISV